MVSFAPQVAKLLAM